MATITTRGEQERVGRLKDDVGGYDEMLRLIKEQKQAGPNAELRRRDDGRLTFLTVNPRRVANAR
jgi:hypothetical protein